MVADNSQMLEFNCELNVFCLYIRYEPSLLDLYDHDVFAPKSLSTYLS